MLIHKRTNRQQIPLQLPIPSRPRSLPRPLIQTNRQSNILDIHSKSRQIQTHQNGIHVIDNISVCAETIEEGEYAVGVEEADDGFEESAEVSVGFGVGVVVDCVEGGGFGEGFYYFLPFPLDDLRND